MNPHVSLGPAVGLEDARLANATGAPDLGAGRAATLVFEVQPLADLVEGDVVSFRLPGFSNASDAVVASGGVVLANWTSTASTLDLAVRGRGRLENVPFRTRGGARPGDLRRERRAPRELEISPTNETLREAQGAP